MLEAAANAAHECAEGKTLPWFACIDQCKDFGPYLLVLVVLLLLSAERKRRGEFEVRRARRASREVPHMREVPHEQVE